MTKYSKEDKDTIQMLHLITGKPYKDCKDFFEGFALLVAISFLKEKPVHIPLFGDIKLDHVGEEFVRGGKKARIKIDVSLNSFLSKSIGQLSDGTESEIQKLYMEKVKELLEKFVN